MLPGKPLQFFTSWLVKTLRGRRGEVKLGNEYISPNLSSICRLYHDLSKLKASEISWLKEMRPMKWHEKDNGFILLAV